MEERRIRWTTFNNIDQWFTNWEIDLVDLGFSSIETIDSEDSLVFPDKQKARMGHLDVSALTLDGKKGNRGGRTTVTFHYSGRPKGGISVSKYSQFTTFITGSTALGESFPPRFQFSTTSKSDETQWIRMTTDQYMMGVR